MVQSYKAVFGRQHSCKSGTYNHIGINSGIIVEGEEEEVRHRCAQFASENGWNYCLLISQGNGHNGSNGGNGSKKSNGSSLENKVN